MNATCTTCGDQFMRPDGKQLRICGSCARVEGKEAAASNEARTEALEVVRDAALRAYLRKGGDRGVTIEDAYVEAGLSGIDSDELMRDIGPAAGSVFAGKDWIDTGERRPSTLRRSNHGRELRVWRRASRAVEGRTEAVVVGGAENVKRLTQQARSEVPPDRLARNHTAADFTEAVFGSPLDCGAVGGCVASGRGAGHGGLMINCFCLPPVVDKEKANSDKVRENIAEARNQLTLLVGESDVITRWGMDYVEEALFYLDKAEEAL